MSMHGGESKKEKPAYVLYFSEMESHLSYRKRYVKNVKENKTPERINH